MLHFYTYPGLTPNKSEKLHNKAINLFGKDKSYSPKAIEGMAIGETIPSKWLVACAIDLLADQKPAIVKAVLSNDDLFMLWAKPLLDSNKDDVLSQLIKKRSYSFLDERIVEYNAKKCRG